MEGGQWDLNDPLFITFATLDVLRDSGSGFGAAMAESNDAMPCIGMESLEMNLFAQCTYHMLAVVLKGASDLK